MRRLYCSLPSDSLEQSEFVPTQWLISWLGDDKKLGPIDNSILLCEHANLNPEKFRDYKLISTTAVKILFQFEENHRCFEVNFVKFSFH